MRSPLLILVLLAAAVSAVTPATWCGGQYDPARGTNFAACREADSPLAAQPRDRTGALIQDGGGDK